MPQVTATEYVSTYTPQLLHPIPRALGRGNIGVVEASPLPFFGEDIWNGYEFSYLNSKGKPVVGIVVFSFPCDSPFLIESKSFKLYLFSFHQSKFASKDEVLSILKKDLQAASKASYLRIELTLSTEAEFTKLNVSEGNTSHSFGRSIDNEDVEIKEYSTNPGLLEFDTEGKEGREERGGEFTFLISKKETKIETLYSDLLKTNCPLTNQPDYGTVQIQYQGRGISHASLLKYLISFRTHNGFHEQCVEHMFVDIMKHCKPEKLCVYARFTRRGGLDINPYRANYDVTLENIRTSRQ